jgi:hypothetical protein
MVHLRTVNAAFSPYIVYLQASIYSKQISRLCILHHNARCHRTEIRPGMFFCLHPPQAIRILPMLNVFFLRRLTISTDCDAAYSFNQGCGVSFANPDSYGATFNRNGGGWYVMERSIHGVFIWFYSRCDPDIPWTVRNESAALDTNQFVKSPDAAFYCDNCDYNSHFDAHEIIFDLTFCASIFTLPLPTCLG